MNPLPPLWVGLSATAFVVASLWLLSSLFVFVQIMSRVFPLMDSLKGSVRELGDISTQTVAHASLTMDMVEQRVGQAMSQANTGSAIATRQSVGVGTVLTGLYLASRVATMLRGKTKSRKPKRRR